MITPTDWEDWQEQGLFNNTLIRKWVSTWELSIKHQKHYALAMLFRGISCLLMKNNVFIQTKNGQIDPRIPIIYFSDSGSGKGMGQTFYQSIFKQLDLRISSIAKPTPEKLIGSFDEQIDKENRKKGLTAGDEKYRDPVIHGFFETQDDIIFDEAEIFFNAKEYGEDILRKSRMAMDTYGSPNNEMKSETLKNRSGYSYYCKCNMIFLSYHIKKLSTQILANGIFQRALCFFYRFGREQMEDIILNPTHDLTTTISSNKTNLVNEIKKISTFIQTLNGNITLSEPAYKELDKIMSHELKKMYKHDPEIAKDIQSFLPRLRETTIKLAGTLAVLKKKNVISDMDVHEAQTIVFGVSFPSVITELLIFGKYADAQKEWYKNLRQNLGNRWRKKEEINDIMGQCWGVSRPTVISRLKKMKQLFVQKQGDKNTQFFKLK